VPDSEEDYNLQTITHTIENHSTASQRNIIIKEASFVQSKEKIDLPDRIIDASDSDFLNKLDAEIRETEQNVKKMNSRFDQ